MLLERKWEHLASVYERHNESSLIPPSEKLLLLFLDYWRDFLASVYEWSTDVFAFQKAWA